MKESIEKRIIEALKGLLTGKVNDILKEAQFFIPLIEISDYLSQFTVKTQKTKYYIYGIVAKTEKKWILNQVLLLFILTANSPGWILMNGC